MFTKQASDDLVGSKYKRVAWAVTPTKIHGVGFNVDAPSIVDVLADVAQKICNRHNLDLACC